MIRDGCFLITDGTVGVAGRCQSRISQHSFGPKRIVCRVRTTQIPFFQNRFFGKFFFEESQPYYDGIKAPDLGLNFVCGLALSRLRLTDGEILFRKSLVW